MAVMILYREFSWWYWAITAALLVLGLSGSVIGFQIAILLSAIQIVHFRWLNGSISAFPTQVRVAYTLLLVVCIVPGMHWLFWAPAIGTVAQVLFGYCMLARIMSLMPWNRLGPLDMSLLRRTFLSPPVRGNIMQGLPAET